MQAPYYTDEETDQLAEGSAGRGSDAYTTHTLLCSLARLGYRLPGPDCSGLAGAWGKPATLAVSACPNHLLLSLYKRNMGLM